LPPSVPLASLPPRSAGEAPRPNGRASLPDLANRPDIKEQIDFLKSGKEKLKRRSSRKRRMKNADNV
jgi:hypothetical protein